MPAIDKLRPIVRPGLGLLIKAPVVGDRIYDALFKRSILAGRSDALVTPEKLKPVYLDIIADLAPRISGPLTYFEAGVFAGQSMAVWHEAARELGVETRSFGVDSFQGLPDSVISDEGGWIPGSFRCSQRCTRWNLARLGAPVEQIRLIEGWFDDTLTPELAAEIGTVHVAMVDVDAYSSTVPVLNFLGPLLHDPAYLVFDDWYSGGNLDHRSGASLGLGVERAFDEWSEKNNEWKAEPKANYLLVRGSNSWMSGHALKLSR